METADVKKVNKITFLLIVLVLLFLSIIIIFAYKYYELSNTQKMLNNKIDSMQLDDKIIRSSSEYATKKDLEKLIKSLDVKLSVIQDDMKKFGAKPVGVISTEVNTPGGKFIGLPSNSTIPRTPDVNDNNIDKPKEVNNDPFGYLKSAQVLKLNEPFNDKTNVPWGEVTFSAWRQNPWDLEIYNRKYRVVNVLGMDENGRHYTYSKFMLMVGNKSYPIKISDSKLVEELPEKKFSFNPKLYLGFGSGLNLSNFDFEAVPNVQLGLFSYGKTKSTPDFGILGVGVGYGVVSSKAQVVVTPLFYNIGRHIPLVNNTYIGPTVAIGLNGDVSALIGLNVGL